MRTKLSVVTLAMFLAVFLPVTAKAGSTTCGLATDPAADGRIDQLDSVAPSTTVWYLFNAVQDRSYSVELHAVIDPRHGDFTLTAFNVGNTDSQCSGGTTTLTQRDTSALEPSTFGSFALKRVSFTAPATGFYQFSVANGSATQTRQFTVSVSETTLFNPLWSTNGAFETFYRIQNTTNATVNVTLTMVNNAGTTVATDTFVAPANGAAPTRNTGPTDLNLADNQAGFAVFTHDGPPGAIAIDGFTGIFSVFPPVVLPVKIQVAREAAH